MIQTRKVAMHSISLLQLQLQEKRKSVSRSGVSGADAAGHVVEGDRPA